MLKIRELRRDDLANGFLASLDSLNSPGGISVGDAEKVFDRIDADSNHVILVAEADGQVVGTVTLVLEQKFIRGGGVAGHLEDLAVRKDFQGEGVGREIVRHLLDVAAGRGCYKTVLHCTDDLVSFYERNGFRRSANGMRFDHAGC